MTGLSERSANNVYHCHQLVDASDVDDVVALFTEATCTGAPVTYPIIGHQEMRSFYSGTRVIEKGEHPLSSMIVDHERIALNGDFVGMLKDGTNVELRFADFFTVDGDGRFSSRATFFFAPMV